VKQMETSGLFAVTSKGTLWFRGRTDPTQDPLAPGNSWQAITATNAADPGPFTAVASVRMTEGLHLCVITAEGGLWHAILPDGSSDGHLAFDNIKEQAGDPGPFQAVSCASEQGRLSVYGVTKDGTLWLTIRIRFSSDPARWTGFQQIPGGQEDRGLVLAVSVVGDLQEEAPPIEPTAAPMPPGCDDIQEQIAEQTARMQALQSRIGGMAAAGMAQAQTQLAGIQQSIAALRQRARELHCP
jgi:hypothetical protein